MPWAATSSARLQQEQTSAYGHEGARVTANSITATTDKGDSGAFLITTAGLDDGYPIIPAEARGNTARIERPLRATGPVARTSALLADNTTSHPVADNMVDIPYGESFMATGKHLESVGSEVTLFAFTQGEAQGRARASLADESSWEGGNRAP